MRCAFKKGASVTVRDVPVPVPAPGQIRLRVEACGICGTDLHVKSGKPEPESGFGHEVAGTITALGPGVTGLAVGQKVALDSSTPCGRCANCRNARQELCANLESFVMLRSFGFAEEMLAPALSAVPYSGLTPEVACLSEPLGVAIDLVRISEIGPCSNVLVMGAGTIGLMALALARRMGARKIIVSQTPRRRRRIETAKSFGANLVVEPEEVRPDRPEFRDIDRVLVTAPPSALAMAFNVSAKGGIVSFIGIGYGGAAECRFDANTFHFKKLQLRASFASPSLFTPMALEFLKDGVVDGPSLVSHRFPLDRIGEAMNVARDGDSIKVVITP